MLRSCERSITAVFLCSAALVALSAPASARKPLRVAVSTETGVDLRDMSVAFHYPRGSLSSDFVPPAWAEPARGHTCQAQLVLTAPTMGAAIVPPELVLVDRFAQVTYNRPSRAPRPLVLEWMFARGRFGEVTTLQYSVAIEAPQELRRYGSVIGIGMYGQVARAGTYDKPCRDSGEERSAVARLKAAARRLIRGFDVSSAR